LLEKALELLLGGSGIAAVGVCACVWWERERAGGAEVWAGRVRRVRGVEEEVECGALIA
jgi:hypothetical protein